jgi:Na+/proline symporter
MLTFLPRGLLGLVIASLIAAYMSTISTHLNWGSSYVVNDFYLRFINPRASQKKLVAVGRTSTVLMMAAAAAISLWLENALQAFQILLQIGAGTGLLFILRWFWWRINAVSEVVAMVVSFCVAIYFQFFHMRMFPASQLSGWQQLCIGVGMTTVCWIVSTLFTRPTGKQTLREFCRRINPGGPGWKKVFADADAEKQPVEPLGNPVNFQAGIICMVTGCIAVYSALFATGMWLYGRFAPAVALTVVAALAAAVPVRMWKRVSD